MPATACKEWAAVVQALLEGEQIVDVRKGGIREEGRHFAVQANRFWLFPTFEHQRPELLKPAYARWGTIAPPHGVVRFEGWADVVGIATITEPDALDALDSKVIWARDYVESRFNWKRRDPLWVLALRVHRLVEPVSVPLLDEYVGCTSWVSVDGVPEDPASAPSEPAMSDVAFEARLKGIREAIPGGLSAPE